MTKFFFFQLTFMAVIVDAVRTPVGRFGGV